MLWYFGFRRLVLRRCGRAHKKDDETVKNALTNPARMPQVVRADREDHNI